jgi:hypothetical protein
MLWTYFFLINNQTGNCPNNFFQIEFMSRVTKLEETRAFLVTCFSHIKETHAIFIDRIKKSASSPIWKKIPLNQFGKKTLTAPNGFWFKFVPSIFFFLFCWPFFFIFGTSSSVRTPDLAHHFLFVWVVGHWLKTFNNFCSHLIIC